MKTWISMLRGINVSGQKKIKMADLRAMFEAAGYSNVRSYVQSGNVVFGTDEKDANVLADAIEAAITETFGFDVSVFLRDSEDFRRIIDDNPYLLRGNADPQRLYVTFLRTTPSTERVDNTDLPAGSADEFIVAGDAVYLHCPGGYGTSKLSNTFFERKLGMPATTRNWNTVNALYEMAAAG